MNEQMRAEFEQDFTKRYTAHKLVRMMTMGGDLADEYKDPRVQYCWVMWQAAHARYAGSGAEPVAWGIRDQHGELRDRITTHKGRALTWISPDPSNQLSLTPLYTQPVGYAGGGEGAVAVAEVVSKYGDPEDFGEREIKLLTDIQKLPYRTKLYASPAPAVPDERLLALLDKVQDALQDAYQNAGLVCCGKSMMDCCGSPVADWSEADQKIMDVLSPIQRDLSAMLTQATKEPEKCRT